MATTIAINTLTPLQVLLSDHNAAVFATATILNDDGVEVDNVTLLNLTNGLYGLDYAFSDAGNFTVRYDLWTSSGHVTHAGYASTYEDFIVIDPAAEDEEDEDPDALCKAIDVFEVAPEFNDLDTGVVNRFILMTSAQIAEKNFGKKAKYACIYLTAHLMSMVGLGRNSPFRGPTGMPLTMAQVGQEMFQAGQFFLDRLKDPGVSGALALTKYGLEYSRILRTCLLGVVVP